MANNPGTTLPGGYRNSLGGPADVWYALPDGTPYASAAEACAAVPAAYRRTRTVFVAGIGEMQWLPGDLSDAGLLAKAGGAGTPAVLYPSLGQNTNGALTQKAATDALAGKAALAHTHTAAQITDFAAAADARIAAQKGQPGGLAPLGSNSLVPSVYLPAAVDEIQEYANLAAFPATGSEQVIYVALDQNKQYRWSGTQYSPIVSSGGVDAFNGRKGNVALAQADVTPFLAGLATAAYVDQGDAASKQRASHSGTQPASTISDFTEAAQDAAGALLASSTTLAATYDDAGNRETLEVKADSVTEGLLSPAVRDKLNQVASGTGGIANAGAPVVVQVPQDGAQSFALAAGVLGVFDVNLSRLVDAGAQGYNGEPITRQFFTDTSGQLTFTAGAGLKQGDQLEYVPRVAGGGAGGTSYDDTALKARVSTLEVDLNQAENELNAVENTVYNNHEDRLDALEVRPVAAAPTAAQVAALTDPASTAAPVLTSAGLRYDAPVAVTQATANFYTPTSNAEIAVMGTEPLTPRQAWAALCEFLAGTGAPGGGGGETVTPVSAQGSDAITPVSATPS